MLAIKDANKKAALGATLLFLAAMYGIHYFVYLNNGDDFMYAMFGRTGSIANSLNYYFTGNGRFWINVVNSFVLRFDRYLFMAINPLLTIAWNWMLAQNIQLLTSSSRDSVYGIYLACICLFCCFDVVLLRETVFWICGAMNYLLPSTLFLVGLYLFQLAKKDRLGRKTTWLYFLVSFFIACSMEQFSLCYIGTLVLVIGYDWFKDKTVHKREIAVLLISLVGLATLLLAPGNYVRAGNATQFTSLSELIDRCWTIVYQNTFSDVSFPFFLTLALCLAFNAFHGRLSCNKNLCLIVYAYPWILLLVKVVPFFRKFYVFLGLIIIGSILLWLSLCREKDPLVRKFLLAFAICQGGSQLMLVVAEVWGFRYMFCAFFINILFILYFLQQGSTTEKGVILAIGLLASFHSVAALAFGLFVLLVEFSKKRATGRFFAKILPALCVLCILIGSSVSLGNLILGYSKNAAVIEKNIERARTYNEGILTIQVPVDPDHTWCYFPRVMEWQIPFFCDYYHLPRDVTIQYVNAQGDTIHETMS